MTVAEKIAGLENRVEQLRLQMKRLLQVASTPEQKEAVSLGHQMTIGDFQDRIDALKSGESDPWE